MGIKTKVSVLGDVSGKVGYVVMLNVLGQSIVRSIPKEKRKATSEKLIKENDIFRLVMRFFKGITKGVFKEGYQVLKNAHMSPYNAAISYHRLNAVTALNGDFGMDLTRLKFSSPIRTTQTGWHPELIRITANEVLVKWELNPCPLKTTQLNDKVTLIFYDQKIHNFMVKYSVRDSLSCQLILPRAMTGDEILCWIFFTSADGKLVSETKYLGVV